jgi:universal stress protein A
MYTTIICAIEASDEGKEILSKAYELSKLYKAKLFITHIIPYTLLPKDYQKELKENVLPEIESMILPLGIAKKMWQ